MTHKETSDLTEKDHRANQFLVAMASESDPTQRIRTILETACELFGASNAGIVFVSAPDLLISTDPEQTTEETNKIVLKSALSQAEHVQVYDGLLDNGFVVLLKIVERDEVVSICWLSFDVAIDPYNEVLQLLIDVLRVAGQGLRSEIRHQKLGHNYSEFLRVVSHDLRSPLTSMQGFASMLESGSVGELNENQVYFVEKILSGITQMTSLVDNIQDAGRFDPETGFYEMERSPCDIAEIVHGIVRNYLVPAEKQELNLTATIADDVPIINADSIMLERAVTNLVDNAIKYTPNGRNVDVKVERRGDQVVISVKDNGLGISAENQKMLFERHVRVHRREHRRVKGSGLGLFIVRSVARRHGGEAWVESEEGVGTTFLIRIPLDDESAVSA